MDAAPQASGPQLLRLACALGRGARMEALLAIQITFASLLASLDELRERTMFDLSCLMARMEVGDMEHSVLVDDSPNAFRALRRAATAQGANLLVSAAATRHSLFGDRGHVDDLIEPAGLAVLGIRQPRQNVSWRRTLQHLFSSPEFPFN